MLAGVLLLATLLVVFPEEVVWRGLRSVPPSAWLLSVTSFLLVHAIGMFKWRLALAATDAPLDRASAAHCYYAGLFGNLLLPSVVGGDAVAVGLAFSEVPNRPGIILGHLIGRVVDLAVLFAFFLLGLLGAPVLVERLVFDGRPGMVVLLLLGAAVAVVVARSGSARNRYRVRRQRAKLRIAWRALYTRPWALLQVGVLGLGCQAGLLLIAVYLGTAAGLHLPLAAWAFVWSVAKVAAVLPITQAGLGTREAAFVLAALPFGAQPAAAIAAALAWDAVLLSGCALAGLMAWSLARGLPWTLPEVASSGSR